MSATTWESVPIEHRHKVAEWLRDQVHDLEVDRESLAEEEGFDLVAAIDALADHLEPLPPRTTP